MKKIISLVVLASVSMMMAAPMAIASGHQRLPAQSFKVKYLKPAKKAVKKRKVASAVKKAKAKKAKHKATKHKPAKHKKK